MSEPTSPVTIALRIPGRWANPRELVDRLPAGCRVTAKGELVVPDGEPVELSGLPADDQFAEIFRSSCRQEPTEDELATVDNYTVNITLSGPGGSLPAARAMMRAAAAIIEAGGAGVFIDNSALAHGGQNWVEMADDGGPDALSFAFVGIIRGRTEIWTMGMHVLGLRDIVMKRADVEGGFDIVEVIRYVCASDKPVDDGHIIADLDGPRFRTVAQESPAELRRGPMHNPFGRLKLVSMRDIAEAN
ncbi:MAG: hypothetical protein J2P46_14260 [Zavarzinella sp.]|nr:hypothetical protein [Zavarzinella sp.]